jgi:hypothetical protein
MGDQLLQAIEAREPGDGIKMSDLLMLPEPLGRALSQMVRNGTRTLSELAADLGRSEAETRPLVTAMMQKGILRETEPSTTAEPVRYELCLSSRSTTHTRRPPDGGKDVLRDL